MDIRTIASAGCAGLLLVTLTACGEHGEASSRPSDWNTLSAADREAQRKAAREAAGLPSEPSATARYAYLEALDRIDPSISQPGKDDQTVSRGISQCGSIKTTKDRDKLIELTLGRFSIDMRLPDINNKVTGGKILDAVHEYLCPAPLTEGC